MVSFDLQNLTVDYRETFKGENVCELVKNTIFVEKIFIMDCSLLPCKHAIPPKFQGETIANSHKTANSQMFSPSKVSRYMVLQHGQTPGTFLQSLGTLPGIGRARYCWL